MSKKSKSKDFWDHQRQRTDSRYSYFGFDPHSLHDRYTSSSFENNRNIALINRAYSVAITRHFAGYGPNAWALIASDGPAG